jgi:hypothetical protein
MFDDPAREEVLAMGFAATMIFYHLIGLGVATAIFLTDSHQGRCLSLFRLATAVLFWPLYIPVVLASPHAGSRPAEAALPIEGDAMSHTISQVEAELDSALASLDGWVEDVLAHEAGRFRELSTAWRAQAARIREMDRLLAQFEPANHEATPDVPGQGASDRYRQSERTRRANLDRLREVRNRAYGDLMGTLAWVRELVSMIHLAKFTGAPPSRAEELVAQVAAAVEGISVVTWQDARSESTARPNGLPSLIPTRSQEEIVSCDFSSESATSSPRT